MVWEKHSRTDFVLFVDKGLRLENIQSWGACGAGDYFSVWSTLEGTLAVLGLEGCWNHGEDGRAGVSESSRTKKGQWGRMTVIKVRWDNELQLRRDQPGWMMAEVKIFFLLKTEYCMSIPIVTSSLQQYVELWR